jgi:hypothetical protein
LRACAFLAFLAKAPIRKYSLYTRITHEPKIHGLSGLGMDCDPQQLVNEYIMFMAHAYDSYVYDVFMLGSATFFRWVIVMLGY